VSKGPFAKMFSFVYSSSTMTVRMRHTRAHTRNRRSHHALVAPAVTTEKETGGMHLRHRVSPTTGMYRGRKVVDVSKKLSKKSQDK